MARRHSNGADLQSRLSALIIAHVREHRTQRGQHLPEQTLADAFRVSRAPIRAALEALAEQGVVRRERNRGFFLAKDGEDLSETAEIARIEDAEDEPYLAVAADRLAGDLPERVTENELMRRYGLTRNRAVAILARIAQEGWAERLPGRGWAFLPVLTSRESYDMGYRFRATIETGAILEPTFRVDPADLARLREEQRALRAGEAMTAPRSKLFRINSEFHETIVSWSGNPFYLDALRRVNGVRRLIEYRLAVDRSRLTRQCDEHLELLDLLEHGELSTAAAFLRVHIEGARRIKAAALT